MVFSSIIFVFLFLPFTLAFYYCIRKEWRNSLLLISSLTFYFWGEGNYALVIILYMVFNYIFGCIIEYFKSNLKWVLSAKIIFILALVFNLGFLVYFKYFNFIANNLNQIWSLFSTPIEVENIHLPIGISFFSFQAISYVFDIYRGDVKAEKNFINFSMYKAFFPQLIAGPIVRYRDISNQIVDRIHSMEKFSEGINRFIIGLGKKVLIANNVAIIADEMFSAAPNEISFGFAWFGVICYSLQIYFDFSGYSDMAIGLGKMFGFDFLENFRYPYTSRSVKEFWSRWHISLSSWFRDYVYISMGGNRVSKNLLYVNLLTVFFLCGLWHGASWTFVIWGLWHGTFLIIERTKFGKFIDSLPYFFGNMYTLLIVLFGWVFFRADSLNHGFQIIQRLFHFSGGTITLDAYLNTKIIIVLIAGIIGSSSFLQNFIKNFLNTHKNNFGASILIVIQKILLCLVFLVSIVYLANATYNPFIYFRF